MRTPAYAEAPFRIGEWVVDPIARRLQRGSKQIRLEPKVMEILLCLAASGGKPVSRETLERVVWQGGFIGQDTLSRGISKLRTALDDDPQAPRYIETIPKHGYRLIADIGPVDAGDKTGSRRAFPYRNVTLTAVLTVLIIALAGRPWRWLVASDAPCSPVLSRPLTTLAWYESAPAVSPDGRHVVFQRYDRDRPAPFSWDLFMVAIESDDGAATPLVVSDLQEHSAAWSPSGDSVAYVREGAGVCSISVVAALGGRPVDLLPCTPGRIRALAWMPDGSGFLVAEEDDGATRLRRRGRTNEDNGWLTSPPDGFRGDVQFAVVPDGRRIAFVRRRSPGVEDLYLLELGSSDPPKRITRDNRRINGVAWSGDAILFSSNRGGNSQLWRVDANGGSPIQVPMAGRNASNISASSTGVVVYEEYTGDTNIWTFTPDSTKPWTTSTRNDQSPTFSPDGSRVAWISDRSGSAEIWMSQRDGSGRRQLTQVVGGVTDPPRWSRDGSLIAYSAVLGDNFDVFVIDVQVGSVRQVTTDPSDDRVPSWSHDGRFIRFASDRSGSWQLWQAESDQPTRVSQLTTTGAFASASNAGGVIYHTRPGHPGIWEMNGGGTLRLVWPGLATDDWANWTVTDEGIYFVRSVESPLIGMVDSKSGDTRVVYEIPAEVPTIAGVSRDPATGALLFSRVDRSESDLWWMNLGRGTADCPP